MSASKAKGTAFETALVRYLIDEGFPVERRALSGSSDKGDIAGLPGWAIEVKNCKTTALAAWVDEADAEGVNAAAPYGGVVWHHRRGRAHPSQAFVTMSGATFVRLLRALTQNGDARA